MGTQPSKKSVDVPPNFAANYKHKKVIEIPLLGTNSVQSSSFPGVARRLYWEGAGIAAKRRKGCSPLYGAERRKRPGLSEVRAVASQSARYMVADHV